MDKSKLEWPIFKKLMLEFSKTVRNQLLTSYNNTITIGEQHPEGVALYNIANKLCFVLLPKNASTTMMYATMFYPDIAEWRLCNFLTEDLEIERFVVVLRDPVTRYISATNMFLTSGEPMLPTRIYKSKVYSDDCHFRAQHEFIQSVATDKIDYFYFNDTVIQDIKDYYNLNFNFVPHHNKGTKLVTAVDETLIKTLYSEDYELINSVKFINI